MLFEIKKLKFHTKILVTTFEKVGRRKFRVQDLSRKLI